MDLNNLFAGVTMTLPGWAVAAAGFGVVLLLILVMRPRSDSSGLSTLAQLALVAVIAGASYFGLKQYEDNSRFVERKVIEDRATALLSQANQHGPVISCLNVAVIPVLDEACERTIFAEPQRITFAIAVTTDRLALLNDAVTYSVREPAFADRFDSLRKSLEADPYGIVAHVLATEFKCIPDSCARLRIFKESERVKANLAYRKFNDLLAKHKESWARTPVTDQFGEIADILTLGVRPDINKALTWGQDETGQTPAAPFVPQAAAAQPPSAPVAARPNDPTPPATNTKQKAAAEKQKQQPAASQQKQPPQQPTQARKKGGAPEPVGGLPRVTARGSNPPADDDDDDTPPAPPAPPQQNRSPFGIFSR